MRISVKCSTAVHMLLMIAELSGRNKVTSGMLASSVGCNPVEIRKLLSSLKKAGIIDVSRGTGGTALRRAPADITLLDIYSAVDATSLNELIGVHMHPVDECPFGRNIQALLAEPYAEIGDAVRDRMRAVTLERLLSRLAEMEPSIHVQQEPTA
ncbi:Rrf2 family transcriptional regulator [Eubacteriales bacterium OttesenSCG-928-A19]|nr:Rrf2 family transcriptional regulator [Eubacteriales bacterium OttesenSCG-928-A19]